MSAGVGSTGAGDARHDGGVGRRRPPARGATATRRLLAGQRRVRIPGLVALGLGGVLLGRALLALVHQRHRRLGDVQRDAQRHGQAHQQADDKAQGEAAPLVLQGRFHGGVPGSGVGRAGAAGSSRFMASGALTPSTASALRSTWAVAVSSARRASASAASSTRKRSAA